MSALDRQMREQLFELARTIGSFADGRRERLRAVTIVAANDAIVADGPNILLVLLRHRGLTAVDVIAVKSEGPLRILSLEFDPEP